MRQEPPYRWMVMLKIKNSLYREFLAELMGTFILMMYGIAAFAAYGLSGFNDLFAITFAWGIGVMLGVSTAGGLTGGHINPAVTLALATLGKLPWKKVPVYMLAQYLGAFLASALVFFTYLEALNAFDDRTRQVFGLRASGLWWATFPNPKISLRTVFLDNFVSSGLLVFTALAVIDKRNLNYPAYLHPLILGLMITATALCFGHNCMAPLNPARDFAPRLFILIAGWGGDAFNPMNYQYWWIAGIFAPHVGGILGGWLYYLSIELHWPDEEDSVEKEDKDSKANGFPQGQNRFKDANLDRSLLDIATECRCRS